MEKELYVDFADEIIYENTFENGLKCFIIPKKGYVEKEVMFAVNYGSADNIFLKGDKVIEEPQGLAHFIEHKLFEQKNYNVFDEFSKYGASSNAFTNFNTTAYYFNCIDNFKENINILFDFVSKPYFTKESVEREKDIISQEIKMYDDDPSWKVYFNLLKCLYNEHTIKNEIAGSTETIKDISEDMLYENYKNFYTYKNSVVICAGDFDRNEVYNSIQEKLKLNDASNSKKIVRTEKAEVANSFIEQKMSIQVPMFYIGVKENLNEKNIAKKILGIKLLLDIVCGESSEFYEMLYKKRYIDKSFGYAYTCGRDYGFLTLSGYSDNSDMVGELFLDEILKFQKKGISDNQFDIIKNKHIGRFKREFNSLDGLISVQADFFSKGISLFDYSKELNSIDKTYIEKLISDLFFKENVALSLIVP